MEAPETRSDTPQRRRDTAKPAARAKPTTDRPAQRAPAFVDPYELPAETLPEEPGYGHGV